MLPISETHNSTNNCIRTASKQCTTKTYFIIIIIIIIIDLYSAVRS